MSSKSVHTFYAENSSWPRGTTEAGCVPSNARILCILIRVTWTRMRASRVAWICICRKHFSSFSLGVRRSAHRFSSIFFFFPLLFSLTDASVVGGFADCTCLRAAKRTRTREETMGSRGETIGPRDALFNPLRCSARITFEMKLRPLPTTFVFNIPRCPREGQAFLLFSSPTLSARCSSSAWNHPASFIRGSSAVHLPPAYVWPRWIFNFTPRTFEFETGRQGCFSVSRAWRWVRWNFVGS